MDELSLTKEKLDACGKKITETLKSYTREAKLDGVTVALSGGIDSSLTLKLTKEALEDVHALILPEEGLTSSQDTEDAIKFAEQLGIKYTMIKIGEIIEAVENSFPWNEFNPKNKMVSRGNVSARARMILCYLASNLGNRLVVGTGNKTELLLGYYTKYGDGGVDIEPLGDLYKTQVKQLAKHVGIPKNIIEKTPSAGLWRGQTDEKELGAPYSTIDRILYHLVDLEISPRGVVEKLGVEEKIVYSIQERVRASEHKRKPPKIIELDSIIGGN